MAGWCRADLIQFFLLTLKKKFTFPQYSLHDYKNKTLLKTYKRYKKHNKKTSTTAKPENVSPKISKEKIHKIFYISY